MRDIEEEPLSPTEIPTPGGGDKKTDSALVSQSNVRQSQCVKVEDSNAQLSTESVRLLETASPSLRTDRIKKEKFLLDLTQLDRIESQGDNVNQKSTGRAHATDQLNKTGFHIRSLHLHE